MTLTDRQHAYSAALEAMNTELGSFLAQLNWLQTQMEQLEQAREALKAFIAFKEQAKSAEKQAASPRVKTATQPAKPAPCPIQTVVESQPLLNKPIKEEPSDPILRRINRALGIPSMA